MLAAVLLDFLDGCCVFYWHDEQMISLGDEQCAIIAIMVYRHHDAMMQY